MVPTNVVRQWELLEGMGIKEQGCPVCKGEELALFSLL